MALLLPKPEPLARVRERKRRGISRLRKQIRVRLFSAWDGQQAESMGLGDDRPCDGGCGRIATAFHHDRPRSLGGQDTLENARALCAVCHAAAHRR